MSRARWNSGRHRSEGLGPLLITLLLWAGPTPVSPVADAAMRGDREAVRTLVGAGADVNAAQGDGMTALHWSAERDDAEMAELLLVAGANARAVTRLGDYTALHLAARSGAASVVRLLLGAGADVEAVTSTGGAAALHFAAEAGSAQSIADLVDHGADVNVRERVWSQTPLMFAAAAGRVEAVEALLALGADAALTARVMDMDLREQEDAADRRRQEQIAEAISAAREGRAVVAVQGGREEIDNQQRDRVPSSRFSHAQLVGAYGGLAAIHLAAREGYERVVFALLDHGVDVDRTSEGDHTSPLLMATINGHFDLAMRLVERGADPTVGNDANATPLYAVLNTQWIPKSRHPQPADYMQQRVTYLELMRALLERGADVNARLTKQLWFTTFGDDYLRVDRMGATTFWRAAYALDLEAMRLLVAHGADPNIPTLKTGVQPRAGSADGSGAAALPLDPSGLPPVPVGGPGAWPIHAASGVGYGEGYAANIHRVVPGGWLPAVRYLVEELGADVNERDHNGYTALHHAAARGDNEMIRYLVDRGADVRVVSRRGQTTVDMANGPVQRISPFPETIALLEGLGAINNHRCVSC